MILFFFRPGFTARFRTENFKMVDNEINALSSLFANLKTNLVSTLTQEIIDALLNF